MSQVDHELTLPRVKLTNGHTGPAVIDIVDPLFVRNHKQPQSPKEVVQSARQVFRTGRTLDVAYRKGQLKQLLRFLDECHQDIEIALYDDLRKHPLEVNVTEIFLLYNDAKHTHDDLDHWAKPKKTEKRYIDLLNGVEIHSDPYGVVLVIGAWNYPLLLAVGPIIGAIAAGNCVILKPSELSPNTSNLLATKLRDYLDKDTFYVVQGGVPETTALLQERFDYIFFTGSTQVGKIVHQAAAKHLTPTTLELGGKSPVYLDNTVDMDLAAKRILWGKLLNSGQTCIGVDYILCTKEVQEKFLESAKKVLADFYGDEKYPKDLSKIITDNHFKRLTKFLDDVDIAVGGQYSEVERVLYPTILINVKKSDPIMQEEIFGPILPIMNISSLDEAIDYINDNEKPLALYIFSDNRESQKRILKETSSGAACINDTIMHICTESLPFGGVGNSGMGSYHGKMGFDTFSHQKAVLSTSLNILTESYLSFRYPPYNESKITLLGLLVKKRSEIIPWCYIKYFIIFLMGFFASFMLHKLMGIISSK